MAVPFVCPGLLLGQLSGSSLGSSSAPGSSVATTVISSTVSGQVINANTGSPIPRAMVRLNNRAVLTDHEGKFHFDQNTESSANILVTKPGFSSSTEAQEPGNVFLQGDQLGAPLELRLYPEAILTGTVIAPDGTPLPRIGVIARRSLYDDSGHRWLTTAQDQTDSHGSFRIPVTAGEYRLETRYTPQDRTTGEAVLPVTVPVEGSSNTSSSIKIRSGEEQHFELRPVVSPTYNVTATTQSAGGGRDFLRITARSSNGGSLQVNPQMMSETGETKLQLPQGTYTLTARKNNPENPEEAETTVTVPGHDVSGVVFQFSSIPSIPVELIVDNTSSTDNVQPPSLPQLGLNLQNEQGDPDRGDSTIRLMSRRDQSFAFTAPPGRYRFQGRSGGTWFVKSANYGDSDLLQQELVVAPGSSGTPIRVTVSSQSGVLQGTVSLNGNPAACWVYLIPTGPSAQSVITFRSSKTGTYTSANLAPGSYQAVAFESRHSANYRDPASLAAYNTHVRSITINAGDKPSLNLDAVPVVEVTP
jgi:hypothetical protein